MPVSTARPELAASAPPSVSTGNSGSRFPWCPESMIASGESRWSAPANQRHETPRNTRTSSSAAKTSASATSARYSVRNSIPDACAACHSRAIVQAALGG